MLRKSKENMYLQYCMFLLKKKKNLHINRPMLKPAFFKGQLHLGLHVTGIGVHAVTCHLTAGTHSEKRVLRRLGHCAGITERTTRTWAVRPPTHLAAWSSPLLLAASLGSCHHAEQRETRPGTGEGSRQQTQQTPPVRGCGR